MKRLIIYSLLIVSSANAFAESIARDALTYMITRYREAKSISPSENREIALACAGEVTKDFVYPYLAVIDGAHLNRNLVTSYKDAVGLMESHLADTENIYPKLRQNLVPAIRQVILNLREASKLDKVPALSLDNYGGKELVVNLQNCNSVEFLETVSRLAPLTGSYTDVAESDTFRVPIGENDGDFGTGDSGPAEPVPTRVKQSLKRWLYEISKR